MQDYLDRFEQLDFWTLSGSMASMVARLPPSPRTPRVLSLNPGTYFKNSESQIWPVGLLNGLEVQWLHHQVKTLLFVFMRDKN